MDIPMTTITVVTTISLLLVVCLTEGAEIVALVVVLIIVHTASVRLKVHHGNT